MNLFKKLSIIILFFTLIHAERVLAVSCDPPESGDFVLTQSCTFDSNNEGIHGIRNGNLIVPTGVTLTLNAGQTIYWPESYSIVLQGGSIAMNNTASLKQGDLDEAYLQTLGFDTYASALPVRIYANNLHVCLNDPCTISAPTGTGNLIVEGKVKIAGGSPGAGKVLTSDANGEATWQAAAAGLPSGMIAAFASACPTGWTEYTAARGRYLVGVPSGGTLSATVGTALTNAENRAVGQHLHSIDPPNTATTTDGSHTHTISTTDFGGTSNNKNWGNGANDGTVTTNANGSHSHTMDIGAFNSANSGSVVGTNAPYIQVRWCTKD